MENSVKKQILTPDLLAREVSINHLQVKEWLNKYKTYSFFSHIDDLLIQDLVKHAKFLEYFDGEKIDFNFQNSLVIVFQGSIKIMEPERFIGGEGRFVKKILLGRTIEIENTLSEKASKNYWIAANHKHKESIILLYLPPEILNKVWEKYPYLKNYLKAVATFGEIQKLKNDLTLLGFNNQERISLIGLLKKTKVKKGPADKAKNALVLLNQGGLSLTENNQNSKRMYITGDLVTIENENVHIDQLNTLIWFTSRQSIQNLFGEERATELWETLKCVSGRGASNQDNENQKEQVFKTREIDEDEDDDLDIDDFPANNGALKFKKKKLPVVMQHDEMDCGAACMTMITRYYGKKVNLPVFRSLVHVTRDGASMLSIKKAAEKTGFDSIGVYSGYNYLNTFTAPFIALMEYHFVVVYKVDEKKVLMADPARGLIEEDAEKFKSEWSQNILLFKPNEKFKDFPESQSSFLKYIYLFSDAIPELIFILCTSLLVTFLGLLAPIFTQLIFDIVLTRGKPETLTVLALGVVTLNVILGATSWARDYIMTIVTGKLDAKFSSLFMKQTFRLPLNFFSVRRVGDITTRLGEIENIRNFFTGKTISIVISFITAFIYTLVLGFYHWSLLVSLMLLMPVIIVPIIYYLPKMIHLQRDTFKAMGKTSSLTFEHFNSLSTLKFLSAEVGARWRWCEKILVQMHLSKKAEYLGAKVGALAGIAQGFVNLFMFSLAIYLFIQGKLSLGQVVAVNLIISSIIGPVLNLVESWQSFNQVGVSLGRVDDIMTSSIEEKNTEGLTEELSGEIEFQNVSFQYGSELSPLVLDEVSLKINPGETIAFVGPSGCGKTTLAFLVNLLYDPTEGKILLNGKNAKDFSLQHIRSQIAMVIQDSQLFTGTIFENISLGDHAPSFEKVIDAAKQGAAHDFISEMPLGYSTKLGEGGSGLSGGQKQRINIARALYRKPKILIMDEATSALDTISEEVIVKNLNQRKNELTTIIIAHRLNTIRNADKIAFMRDGRLIEIGSHEVLIARGGEYAALFNKQMNG